MAKPNRLHPAHSDAFYESRLLALCPDWRDRLADPAMLADLIRVIMAPRRVPKQKLWERIERAERSERVVRAEQSANVKKASL